MAVRRRRIWHHGAKKTGLAHQGRAANETRAAMEGCGSQRRKPSRPSNNRMEYSGQGLDLGRSIIWTGLPTHDAQHHPHDDRAPRQTKPSQGLPQNSALSVKAFPGKAQTVRPKCEHTIRARSLSMCGSHYPDADEVQAIGSAEPRRGGAHELPWNVCEGIDEIGY